MKFAVLVLLTTGCAGREPSTEPPVETDDTDPPDTVLADTDVDTDIAPVVCPLPALQAVFDTLPDWPRVTSCGHTFFQAMTADQRQAVQLQLDTRERTFTVGQSITIDLGRPGAVTGGLVVHEGSQLAPLCANPDDTGLDPTPTRTWRATEGVAAYTVSAADGAEFTATLTLTGVVIEAVGGGQPVRCTLPDASFADLHLGWYLPAEG